MDNVSLALSSVLMIAFVLMLAPSVIRMNKGVALRNAAIWVGLFCLLALAYKQVGPGQDDGAPDQVMQDQMDTGSQNLPDEGEQPEAIDQDQNFEPPRE